MAPPGRAALQGRPRRAEVTGTPVGAAGPGPEPDPDPPPEGPPPPGDETSRLRTELAERIEDLLRVKAEYDNYRKRVRRDRLAVREAAVANVLRGLLPVLDALDEARAQGEVTGGFQAVAGLVETHLAELGLRSFGEVGDPFDPARHEALEHRYSEAVERPVCTAVLRPGYQVGGQLLRPAEVVVAEPPDIV